VDWLVDFDNAAVLDLEDIKSRGDRKAVFNAIEKLRELGPQLRDPHMKSLKGEADLFELRPRQGASAVRPIYARLGNVYVVLAVSRDKPGLGRAIREARRRLERREQS
jgi:hypothetical protein